MFKPSSITLPDLLPEALLAVAEIGEPHRLKAAFALDRIGKRFPDWQGERAQQLYGRCQFMDTPTVRGLLHTHLHSPVRYGPRAAERLIARGVFPLAYRAAYDWAAAIGTPALLAHYRERALNEPGYLGHGLSIWLAFVEAVAQIDDDDQQALLLERFVEFAARAFPGYPNSDANWQPPAAPAPQEADFASAMAAACSQPGFYGHHLIALAAAYRLRSTLGEQDSRRGYGAVLRLCHDDYVDAGDQLHSTPLTAPAWRDADWPKQCYQWLLRLRPNIHVATLGDAVITLWDAADAQQRRGLQAAMLALV